jgi:hypothetical protein
VASDLRQLMVASSMTYVRQYHIVKVTAICQVALLQYPGIDNKVANAGKHAAAEIARFQTEVTTSTRTGVPVMCTE